MEVANTLAYYDTATITALKSYIVQAPGVFISGKPFQPSLMFVWEAMSLPELVLHSRVGSWPYQQASRLGYQGQTL